MATEENGAVEEKFLDPIRQMLASLGKGESRKGSSFVPSPFPDPAAEMLEKTVEVTDKKAKDAAEKGEAVYSVWTCPVCKKQHVLEHSDGMKVQCACSREGTCSPSGTKRLLKKS